MSCAASFVGPGAATADVLMLTAAARTDGPKVDHEGLHKRVVLHSSPPEVCKVCF
jgi:hypothetical protein